MAQGAVIFGNNQESGDEELSGASPLAINVLSDGKGTVRRRPGISAYSEAPAAAVNADGISGLFCSSRNKLIAIGGLSPVRTAYLVAGGGASEIPSVTGTTYLEGDTRPNFAEYQDLVFVAGGGPPMVIDTTANTKDNLGSSSAFPPPDMSSIVAQANRLSGNDLTDITTAGNVRYSALGLTGVSQWESRRYFAADARPDPVVAVAENTNEIFVFGTTTLQVYTPDPTLVYAPQRNRNIGCLSGGSIIRAADSFAWLAFDGKRKFVMSDGRDLQDIGNAISAQLAGLSTVDDCFGYRVNIDQFDCLVWTFPTDGLTFCYQLGAGWSEWLGWDGTNYKPFTVQSQFARPDSQINVVGTTAGKIAKIDVAALDDLGDYIKAEVKTGFINRQTDARKWCRRLRIGFKRGVTASTTAAPIALISWRDDGGDFVDPLEVSLGALGDYDPMIELASLGVYRRRQWKLEFTDNAVGLTLSGASEDFDILSN